MADLSLFRPRRYRDNQLWLLCQLIPLGRSKRRSQPIQTWHRPAPFKGPVGRYPQISGGCTSVGVDLRGLPNGVGIYLRLVNSWHPRAEVLARCRWRGE